MVVTLNTKDPRSLKALAIAAEAGQWLKARTRDGRKAYGVPSSKDDGRYYLTTAQTCDCEDFRRRELPCKHIQAVHIHCAFAHAMRLATERAGERG